MARPRDVYPQPDRWLDSQEEQERVERIQDKLDGMACILCGNPNREEVGVFEPDPDERERFAFKDQDPSQIRQIHYPICLKCATDFNTAPAAVAPEVEQRIARDAAVSRGDRIE